MAMVHTETSVSIHHAHMHVTAMKGKVTAYKLLSLWNKLVPWSSMVLMLIVFPAQPCWFNLLNKRAVEPIHCIF